ncbi:Aste57867_24357 [Aphanomyces stellatus]|uniref:Aste57867_24357 protein n=1 Tax=Aphanomyces stellatus TaxID=120398 RepID=A0A485LQF7_9STRA|nr:hypothetical protein As57867_024281 [Aphanomyces stellatus]VFU00997.1 Aste57867_24357 [Aphanomyces stellatus]
MPKVYAQSGPSLPASQQPRAVRVSTLSLLYTLGYVVNLGIIPFKAYLSEPLPWALGPAFPASSLDPSTDAFATTAYTALSTTFNNVTVPSGVAFTRDGASNAYLLRYVVALPTEGDAACVKYMHYFPGALLYSRAMAAFVCDFVARNASARTQTLSYSCQQNRQANVVFSVICTWVELTEDATMSTYTVYHAGQQLESQWFSWLKFGVRCGLSGFILHALWHLYYRHYIPLVHNLRTVGIHPKRRLYTIQMGDPTWLILSHPFVSFVMAVDTFVNAGYGVIAVNRASQVTNLIEFGLGCLYGSRTVGIQFSVISMNSIHEQVWAAYMTMRFATPFIKFMHWEEYFEPVDAGLMTLTASIQAGPVMYLLTRTPIVSRFQLLQSIAAPAALQPHATEGSPGFLTFLAIMVGIPVVNSMVSQWFSRRQKKHTPCPISKFASVRFNDWKHRLLLHWHHRRRYDGQQVGDGGVEAGGTMYQLFETNPRYKQFPLVSTRGSDCFVVSWDEVTNERCQIRLSLLHALDFQPKSPEIAIHKCPTAHTASAMGYFDHKLCGPTTQPCPHTVTVVHLGANHCQWVA